MTYPAQFVAPLIFLFFAALFVGGSVLVPKIVRICNRYPRKTQTYECGETPVGPAWVRFNIRYYVVAIIFLIFDVEVLFLFPWAVVFKDMSNPVGTANASGLEAIGFLAFTEVALFVIVLVVGLIYVWKEGHLDWILEKNRIPSKPTHVITKEERQAASAVAES